MPVRLGHLRLDVEDLDRMVTFYTDVVGLHVHERATDAQSHYAFLTDCAELPGARGPMHHRLVLRQARAAEARSLGATARLDHLAFEVASPADLLDAVGRLRRAGAEVDLQDAGIAWQCYTRDPEGIRLEIYCDRRLADGGRLLWHGLQAVLEEETIRGSVLG